MTVLKVSKYRVFSGPYSVRMRENTKQKKLRIRKPFAQGMISGRFFWFLNFYSFYKFKNRF